MKTETEILKDALADLQTYIEDIGGCDHSVGICCCDLIRHANALEELIKTKQS